MFPFFEEDFSGIPAQTLNWIGLGLCLIVGILLIFAVYHMVRGTGLKGGRRGKNARLAVTDATAIGDDRRKLVLVRRDEVEHLLLIGGPTDLVIERDIIRTAPQNAANRTRPATRPTQPASPLASKPAPPESDSVIPPIATPANKVALESPIAAAPTAPAPAPAATPEPAPTVAVHNTPPPASAPSQPNPATKVIAAAAAGASVIPSFQTSSDNLQNDGTNETTAAPVISSDANDTTVDSAINATAEPKQSLNPVEEMDALLDEITTDK